MANLSGVENPIFATRNFGTKASSSVVFTRRRSQDLARVTACGVNRLRVFHATGKAAIASERFLYALRGIERLGVVGMIADKGHELPEPFHRGGPVGRDIDERIRLEADGMARPIVEGVNAARRSGGFVPKNRAGLPQGHRT